MHWPSSIRLNRRKLKRAAAVALGVFVVLALAVVLSCWYLGVHSSMDVLAYRCMIAEHYHPIWKDLALRRIRKGDDVESLVKEHPPAQRYDYGPYTHLEYTAPGSFNTLGVLAKDGRLFAARAGSCTWHHLFFETPEEWEAFDTANRVFWQQKVLESKALQIHRVVKAGQDVFLARLIERHETREELGFSEEMLQEYVEIYGADYLESMRPVRYELTVEVTRVLYGNLQVGAVLTFPGDACNISQAGEAETVFLHVEDLRLISPHSKGGEMYTTGSREALDWYQSLTEDQVREFEARCLAERAKRAR